MAAKVKHNGRTTDRVPAPNDDLEAVFAEAERKASERDGVSLTVGGRTFELWPSRLTHAQKMGLYQRSGMTIEGAVAAVQSAPLEALSTLVAASMFQTTGNHQDLTGVAAWLTNVLEESDDDVGVVWATLSHDEAVAADPLERSDIS